MKAVLLSVNPLPSGQIASRIKKVEVRKTKPKLPVPFKAYIYCTKGKPPYLQSRNNMFFYLEDKDTIGGHGPGLYKRLNGTVLGEFVCDAIIPISVTYSDPDSRLALRDFPFTCLTDKQIIDYLGNGKTGYGWHISDLKIYETPKDLTEFIVPSKLGCCNEGKCRGCIYLDRGNGFNVEDDCSAKFSTDEYKPLRRPPQSWCYVEELQG